MFEICKNFHIFCCLIDDCARIECFTTFYRIKTHISEIFFYSQIKKKNRNENQT